MARLPKLFEVLIETDCGCDVTEDCQHCKVAKGKKEGASHTVEQERSGKGNQNQERANRTHEVVTS